MIKKINKFVSDEIKNNKKVLVGIAVVGIIAVLVFKPFGNKQQAPQNQTATAEKGTLVESVSASGNITTGNNLNITTSATGTVNQVYVKNGDTVKQGDKIADITLDQSSLQRQTSAWSSYLSAKNSLQAAKDKINSLQAAEFKANQTFINDAVARNLVTSDPTYIQEDALWLQAEADYKNQAGVITQSQSALTSSWYAYQQMAPTITAPATGVVSNLMIAPGILITGTSNSNGTVSTQQLGTIVKPAEHIQSVVNLSEIDAPKIKAGQKVTMTLDAFSDKTFTGKVLIVNTNGVVSSGVTTYPATIIFDTDASNIYPNMGVSAKIITNVKDNVILVPSAAVQTSNGESTVRILKNGQVSTVTVGAGDSNDTQTEIVSGISEGDTIVTSVSNGSINNAQGQNTSPFGAFGGNRGFGGGGNIRIQGR